MSNLRSGLKLQDIIEKYEDQKKRIPEMFQGVIDAQNQLKAFSSMLGTHGNVNMLRNSFEYNYVADCEKHLLCSSWYYVYEQLNIEHIAPKTHIKQFENLLQNPPEFDWDNITSVFKEYVLDPRGKALQAFAEVFCNLDPFYKSHDNFGVGKKGLPKRVIVTGCGSSFYSYGWEKVADVINALLRYRGLGHLVVQRYKTEELAKQHDTEPFHGMTFKVFQNGNTHIAFDKQALEDINNCLAEYYGTVLADAYEHTEKPSESKAVSKDLQFYRTPNDVAEDLIERVYIKDDDVILEPSCGDGAIMDAIRKKNRNAELVGVEFHTARANEARLKGHTVYTDNFLTWKTDKRFTKVIMNPPFYGKHYQKHIAAALDLLQEGGELIAILPSNARYKHGFYEGGGRWRDLPTGSFSESGTNVSVSTLTIQK